MNEKLLRELAIQRYEKGQAPKAIYDILNKTKQGFFKYIKS
jgi:hypothetical protein